MVVTLHNLLEHLAANTWVILKIAIISFFIVNCWPYAVESALLNFAKNAFIILPYTRDIHVLAVHVEMSLFTMLTRLSRLSPELPSLTFKIHSQESDLHGAALASLSSDVSAQNAGVWHVRKPCPSGTGLALRLFPGGSRAVNVYRVCWMLTRPYHNYCLFWGNGRYLFKRISCWTKSIQVQLVLSYSLVNIHCKSLILNQFSFNSLWLCSLSNQCGITRQTNFNVSLTEAQSGSCNAHLKWNVRVFKLSAF